MTEPRPWPRSARIEYYRLVSNITLMRSILRYTRPHSQIEAAVCRELLICAGDIRIDLTGIWRKKGSGRWPNKVLDCLMTIQDQLPVLIATFEKMARDGYVERHVQNALIALNAMQIAIDDAPAPEEEEGVYTLDLWGAVSAKKWLDMISAKGGK